MKKFIALLIVILVAAGVYYTGVKKDSGKPKILYYANPMDPSIHSDKPMKDPMGMDYIPVYEEVKKEKKILYYANPMDATIHSDKPMKDPMGMDYIPVYEDDKGGESGKESGGVKGYAGVTISPDKQQLIGVQRGKVAYRDLTKVIKAYGKLSHDTELYNVVQEYKNAASYYNELKSKGATGESLNTARTLLQSVEFKLKLMGFGDAQIRELASGSSSMLLTENSSRALVYAEIYEQDISFIRKGQEARITSSFMKDRKFSGRIIAVDPSISPETRTLRVRIMVSGLPPEVKHESYVDVEILVPAGNVLSIPEDSVIDTGERKVVFVDKGEGRFEPRQVKLGRYINGYYEVLGGVSDNETVITGANFLIDSESQLKAALKGMQ